MKIFGYIICFAFINSVQTLAQSLDKEYFFSINGNLYIPINDKDKGVYPIVGFDKDADSKMLIGGIGVGISALNPVHHKINLKWQVNLSKHTYWDKPAYFYDAYGNAMGEFLGGSTDYSFGLTVLAHFRLKNKFSLGTGVGGQFLLISLSRVPTILDSQKSIVKNHHYRPILPTLPVEVSYKLKNKLFNIRYEHGLLNRVKGELGEIKNVRNGIIYFEIGFKI
ncbi:hypothetical protein BH23BAC1_BH23BAC1_34050 [soil metagenome]